MALYARSFALLALVGLCGCAASQPQHEKRMPVACSAAAEDLMTQNMRVIQAKRYGAASTTAETAARVSLRCGDRWHAANELIVAAELAHENHNAARADRLLHSGVAMMRSLRTVRADDVTSSLLARRLDTSKKELQGQWTYW